MQQGFNLKKIRHPAAGQEQNQGTSDSFGGSAGDVFSAIGAALQIFDLNRGSRQSRLEDPLGLQPFHLQKFRFASSKPSIPASEADEKSIRHCTTSLNQSFLKKLY